MHNTVQCNNAVSFNFKFNNVYVTYTYTVAKKVGNACFLYD